MNYMILLGLLYFQLMKGVRIEACYWSGSDSGMGTVATVYLDCAYGKLTWYRPTSALLVQFNPTFLNTSYYWTACLRILGAKRNSISIMQLDGTLTRTQKTIRNGAICFITSSSAISIYLQANITQIYNHVVTLYYTVRPGSVSESFQKQPYHCAPCTNQEIVNAFCRSDLVFKGHYYGSKQASLYFTVDSILRRPFDSSNIFRKSNGTIIAQIHTMVNCFEDTLPSTGTNNLQYLIISRTDLGQAELVCAPLMNEWLKLRQEILDNDQVKDFNLCDVR